MNAIWDKVWSDLWHNKIRTLLAALSIAVGVFALGMIFGMINQLTPGLNRVHQEIIPAHLTMRLLDRVDEATVTRLKSIKGVTDVEAQNELRIRYRLTPTDEWQPGVLTMRANYKEQKYNLLQLKEGEWPRRDNVGIDIRAIQYLNLEFGDKIIFELDGTDRALPITSRIRHHFITSPDFGSDANFFVDAQGLERFNIPDGEFNTLLVRIEPYSDELAHEMASEIKDRLGKIDVGIATTFYNKPDEHWGQQFFDGLYLVLQLLAVVSLGMSVVLIFNTLTALITQQTNQIGIIKAIGGQTGTITQVYLMGVLVYGILALFVSLPLGAFMAFNVSRYFLSIFNIEHDVFQLSSQAVMIQVMAALAVPLITALWPIWRGARITVREAIASYGLGSGNFGTSPLDKLIERLGTRFLSAPNAVALGNMFRRKGRLGLTQLVLITAGTMFLMVMTLSSSITFTVDNELARRDYAVRIDFEDNQRIDRLVKLAESVEGVTQAQVRFIQPAALLKEGQRTREAGVGIRLIGVPIGQEMHKPRMIAGRWLQPGDERAIVLNEETAEDNDLNLGDTVTLDMGELGDRPWQIVGMYRVLSVIPEPDDIYASQAAIFRATTKHNEGRELLVRTQANSPLFVDAVTTRLKNLFERRNREVDDSQAVYENQAFFDNLFAQYIPMLMALAVVVAAVGGIGLMGSLSISVVERTKEIGVMRAIGAKTPVIMGMFVLEGLLQGLVSWLAAVPLSFVLGQYLAAMMGQALFNINLDYQFHTQAVMIWLVTVLLISILAALIPARNATLISVRESLAYA